ncbi:hypothetical protein [Mycolicibacterium poriferae]|uniref:hypothetical protein n=1 Tax=Mycolicibacterium poriferae TaxID=39694 RepID=UPI00321B6290
MGNRGDSFARWYLALPKGRKYVVSLGLASITLLTPTLIMSELIAPRLGGDKQQVEVRCSQDGSWTVWVDSDDPRLNSDNIELSFYRICDVDVTF